MKKFYEGYCDPKFHSQRKLPAMEDSKITAADPLNGYGETTTILTREQQAKEL